MKYTTELHGGVYHQTSLANKSRSNMKRKKRKRSMVMTVHIFIDFFIIIYNCIFIFEIPVIV